MKGFPLESTDAICYNYHMKHYDFERLANALGFARVYFTEPVRFDFISGNEYNLVMDAKKAFPFASCIAVLVHPYAPFDAGERIPAYYLASNSAYHACKELIMELKQVGIHAERANIPLKSQLLSAGVGVRCKNSLIALPGYGTRIVLQALAIDVLEPLSYDESVKDCGKCNACMIACPALAIGEKGFNVKKCMRAFMETADHPDWVKRIQRTYIGCEICQYACPRNAEIESTAPSSAQRDAFDTHKLIAGETKKARELVGRNMTSNGKLTAEAISMAARDENAFFSAYADELKRAQVSEFPAVQDALRYADSIEGRNNED